MFGMRLPSVFSASSWANYSFEESFVYACPSYSSLVNRGTPALAGVISAFEYVWLRDVDPPAIVATSSPLLALEFMKSKLKFLFRLLRRDELGLGRLLRRFPAVYERFEY